MGLDELKDKALDLAKSHSDQVDDGVEKLAELAEKKFGHKDQIDTVAQKIEDAVQHEQ